MVSSDSLDGMDVVEIPNKDKVVHFAFYYVFTVFWFLCLREKYGAKTKAIVFFLAVLYGGLIEICQLLFTSGRSADVLDVAANTLGSAAGILTIWLFVKIKK